MGRETALLCEQLAGLAPGCTVGALTESYTATVRSAAIPVSLNQYLDSRQTNFRASPCIVVLRRLQEYVERVDVPYRPGRSDERDFSTILVPDQLVPDDEAEVGKVVWSIQIRWNKLSLVCHPDKAVKRGSLKSHPIARDFAIRREKGWQLTSSSASSH